MMQKNEVEFLDPWLRYHGYMFGFENLSILDNGSTERSVIDTLHRFEKVGVNIYWDFQSPENFEHKGDIIRQIIQEMDRHDDYDLAFPLDCDEFICAMIGKGLSVNRQKIHTYLDSIVHHRVPHLVTNGLQNIPDRPGLFYVGDVPKGFFSAGTIKYLDKGYHHPEGLCDGDPHRSNIAYVHLHNRPFEKVQKYSAQKLKHLVDLKDPEKIRDHRGHGEHLTKYFLMTEEEYMKQYDLDILVYFRDIVTIFDALGIDISSTFGDLKQVPEIKRHSESCVVKGKGHDRPSIFDFDIEAYCDKYSDISYFSALHHFLHWGYVEGRTSSRTDCFHAVGEESCSIEDGSSCGNHA